jgi:hypothetical protein
VRTPQQCSHSNNRAVRASISRSATGSTMPSVAEKQPLITAGKKRRREEVQSSGERPFVYARSADDSSPNLDADDIIFRPNFPHFPSQQATLALGNNQPLLIIDAGDQHARNQDQTVPRRILALPISKRARIVDEEDIDLYEPQGLNSYDIQSSRTRPSRSSQSSYPSRILQDQSDVGNRTQPARTNSTLLLTPCHICHRKPTKKSDLDSFADCLGCGQRTCYICIRECQGWIPEAQGNTVDEHEASILSEQEVLSRSFHMDDVQDAHQDASHSGASESHGQRETWRRQHSNSQEDGWAAGGHRQVVCSRCCIEKGSEGDVVCLGCLARMEAV